MDSIRVQEGRTKCGPRTSETRFLIHLGHVCLCVCVWGGGCMAVNPEGCLVSSLV